MTTFSTYVRAAVMVAAATALGVLIRAVFAVPDVEMVYLLVVLLAGIYLGRGPSVLAAALGVVAYDFFFVAPHFTFAVADGRYFLTFAMMFAVGLAVSTLASRLRSREARTRALYTLTGELGATSDAAELARVTARHAAQVFDARAVVLMPGASGELEAKAAFPPDTVAADATVRAPIAVGDEVFGVLALLPVGAAAPPFEEHGFLETFCRQAALAFGRAAFETRAREAVLRARAEELRSSLLSSVSHDLRTPLAAITGAATTLRDDTDLPPQTREDMLATICEEAERLERLVANLLDMTRLESGAVNLRREWVPVEELVGSALTRLDRKLADHAVRLEMPPELPLVSVDPTLIEQLFINLLENAAKHTPERTEVTVQARTEPGGVFIEVADRGPGLPGGEEELIFDRFHRGARSGVPGAGLGLAICRAIAKAHGGTLMAANRAGGGAVFRLTLPPGKPPLPEMS
jgi:two-component system sensor histidine kinase KdpD